MSRLMTLITVIGVLLGTAPVAAVAAPETMILVIKDHRFEPSELNIPAKTKIRLIVKNLDPTPEEFESFDLNREKVVGGGGEIVIFIGPLKPGIYGFYGEFNIDTAQGRIIVK